MADGGLTPTEAKFSDPTQFDPDVVKTFLSMPETIWDDLRKQINTQIHRYTYPEKFVKTANG